MYCKKCNKYGKFKDAYCSECGEKLTKKEIKFEISKKAKNTIIAILVFLAIIFISFNLLEYFTSPRYKAEKYFNAIVNNDIDKIYSYLEEYDSNFISKKILNEKIDLFENVDYYEIINIEETENEALVEFEYVISGKTQTAYVLLTKTYNKYGFNNWKINSAKLIENINIKVPTGSVVTIDEQEITSYLKEDNNEYYDIYEIPYMISGEYKIKTVLNDITVEDKINVEDNKTYFVSNIELEKELKNTLENIALEKINYVYSNAIKNISFDEIKSNLNENMERIYKVLKRSFSANYIKINEVLLKDIEITNATYDREGNLQISFETDYNINYTYTQNDVETTANNESVSNMVLTFKHTDLGYELYDIVELLNLKVRW